MVPLIDKSHIRDGAFEDVSDIFQTRLSERVFIVVDRLAYSASGASERLPSYLEGRSVSWFDRFELNPKIEDVQRGVIQARQFEPDSILAIGGGTAIDLAKLIGAFHRQPNNPLAMIEQNPPIITDSTPVIAVPTTAGTGSEATHFAVVYVNGAKHSVAHPSLMPEYAIVDATLTHSLPARMTAATGLDAFCQAIESIWAVGATDESIGYATEALQLVWQHLVPATRSPTAEARRGMSLGSYLAGRAINISKTTASHAISYPLTSLHGIPHGMAVATTVGQMLVFNSDVTDEDCLDPRGAEHVRSRIDTILKLLDASDVIEGCSRIRSMVAEIGCPSSFAEAGLVKETQIRRIVSSVNAERMSNNPRRTNSEILLKLLADV